MKGSQLFDDQPPWAKTVLIGASAVAASPMPLIMGSTASQIPAWSAMVLLIFGSLLGFGGLTVAIVGFAIGARSRPWPAKVTQDLTNGLLLMGIVAAALFLANAFNPILDLRDMPRLLVGALVLLLACAVTLIMRLERADQDSTAMGRPWLRFAGGLGLALVAYCGLMLWNGFGDELGGQTNLLLQLGLGLGILLLLPQIVHAATSDQHWSPAQHPEGLAGFFLGFLAFFAVLGAGVPDAPDGADGFNCASDWEWQPLGQRWVNGSTEPTPMTHVSLLTGPPEHVLGEWIAPTNASRVLVTPSWSGAPLTFALEYFDESWTPYTSETLNSGEVLDSNRRDLEGKPLRLVVRADTQDSWQISSHVQHQHEVLTGTC